MDAYCFAGIILVGITWLLGNLQRVIEDEDSDTNQCIMSERRQRGEAAVLRPGSHS